ncbi:MAG: hypothetical protein MUE72_05020 [Chitinophagaceae bacterium]|jgi:hypothetical protein|nr:hypothetical protein [Chitinophagaceae bacterium]
MKKILLTLIVGLVVVATQAQTKVTKESIVGKWNAAIIKVEGMIYFDLEKDSLVLSPKILEQLSAAGADSASATEMMKGQFGAFKQLAFEFKADGNYSIGSSSSDEKVEMGSYSLDEATSTLTMDNKEKGETQKSPVSFKDGNLILNMGEGEQKAVLEFKKSK